MILFFVATWVKVNSFPVSFGTKDSQYGAFTMPFTGDLAAMKLVNLHGYVTCDTQQSDFYSYWGCGSHLNQKVAVVITDDTNQVILPIDALIQIDDLTSIIPGYSASTPELVMSFIEPRSVLSGQELRLWYAEDLKDLNEEDNGGSATVEVYALYI